MAIVGDNPHDGFGRRCGGPRPDNQRCPAPGGGGEQRPAHRGRAGRPRPVRPAGRTPPRTSRGPGSGPGSRRGDGGCAQCRCRRRGVAGRGDRRCGGGRVDHRAVYPAGRSGDRRLSRRTFAVCGHRERMVCRAGPARSRRASARARGRAGHRCRVRACRERDTGPAPGRAAENGARSRARRCRCAGVPPRRRRSSNDRGVRLSGHRHLPQRPRWSESRWAAAPQS